MTGLPAAADLAAALHHLLPQWPARGEVILEPLPSSRPVFRLISPESGLRVVGKFFQEYPPRSAVDRGLVWEHDNYLWAAEVGLTADHGARRLPRLLGCCPEVRLGLLLEDIPGPDLDHFLAQACQQGKCEDLRASLENLAELLAFFHSRGVAGGPLSPQPALAYFDKVRGQLRNLDLLAPGEDESLEEEGLAWELLLHEFPDCQVVVHGDATPTNFLFPAARAVALDLERLGPGDRLWDLSWMAGELKHAWVWRRAGADQAEDAITHFFSAYFYAIHASQGLRERVYRLNPFFMALAELRIARNAYLGRDYARSLVAEARRCLSFGRRLA